MSWIKDLTGDLGDLAGSVIKAPLQAVGEVFDSEFLKDVGEGAYRVTKRTGEMVGDVTEGVVDVVSGTINSDKEKQSAGVERLVDTGVTYAKGLAKGTASMFKNSVETVGAIINGDTEKVKKFGKETAKAAAIGALGIGALDLFGGIFDGDFDNSDADDVDVDVEDVDASVLEADYAIVEEATEITCYDVPVDSIDPIDDAEYIVIDNISVAEMHDVGENFDNVWFEKSVETEIYDSEGDIVDFYETEEVFSVENEDMHYVTPHERVLSDGREIWVDGDGDTSVDRDTGWFQTNPDYKVNKI